MNIPMVFELSTKALKIVQLGKAFLSSGGVRMADGSLLELARPLMGGVSGAAPGIGSVNVQIISSLSANVQNIFIQKSVNKANAGINKANLKLDQALSQLNQISTAVGKLDGIYVLSWVNAAFSLANCCVSVAGFHMALKRLSALQEDVQKLIDMYKHDRQADMVERYSNLMMYLRNHLDFLTEQSKAPDRQAFINRELFIETHLTDASNYLRKITDAMRTPEGSTEFSFQSVYTMAVLFAQVLNEYCCRFYYTHGKHQVNYALWLESLDALESSDLRKAETDYMATAVKYAAASPLRRKDALELLHEAVREQKTRLAVCHEVISMLSEQEYGRIDDLLCAGLLQSIQTACPDLDRLLTDRIRAAEVPEEETELRIPLQLCV